MKNKRLLLSITVAGVALAAIGFAGVKPVTPATTLNSSTNTATNPVNTQIQLYANAGDKKPIASLKANATLVPIIHHGTWVKVGIRPSGKTGWVNRPQYEKARRAFYQPNIQNFVVSVTEDKNGKPTMNIVAYKNGKKLSSKAAKTLYKKMRLERAHEYNTMGRMNALINHFMDRDPVFFQQPWDDFSAFDVHDAPTDIDQQFQSVQ